jgi:hypothetical protein
MWRLSGEVARCRNRGGTHPPTVGPPVRGKEARFAEFVRQFRETFSDQANRYRLEGIDDGR